MISAQGVYNTKTTQLLNKNRDTLKTTSLEKNYIKTHFDAIVVDTHNDFIWQVHNKGADLGVDNGFTHSDIPKFKKGGVDVQVFAVWIPMKEVKRSLSFTKKQINRLYAYQDKYFKDFEVAKTYEDIIRITNEGKLCGLIGVEGGTAIENSVDNVNLLWEEGVRYIGLTWNNSNLIAISAKDETEKGKRGGLTAFGVEVIKRMDEVGMLIDVSHLGEASFWDVMKTTRNPVIASHSNVYSINPHFRNLTDEQIKAIAKTGGVIHVNFYDEFLDKNAKLNRTQNAYQMFSEELNELNEKYGDDLILYNKKRDAFLKEKNLTSGTTIEILLDHIDYIKNLVGIDHIGIGSDFDGGITPPVELYDATTYPILTKRLFERGYKEDEVKKILGGNFLRLFKKVCG
ncbi:MAG TPA: dipeptidase [Ignavibacteria bacterium]|nr:dipeptidase [Ignavibacteria bacterium]